MTEEEARAWLLAHVSRETIAKLEAFVALLRDEMARQNLISPASAEHVWARHVVDSLQLLAFDDAEAKGLWIDIGSGAGFPGIVAAIAGGWPVVMIEPRPLRTAFLERVVGVLGLNAHVITGKAQDIQIPSRQPFVSSDVEKRSRAEPDASRLRSKRAELEDRHCEERGDEAIQTPRNVPGLLRFARNDARGPHSADQPPGVPAAVISARAVAPATKLFAWAHHLSRPDTIWLLPKGKSAASELAEAKRTWQGRFHVKQSVTDPDAGIIVARDVRRRRA